MLRIPIKRTVRNIFAAALGYLLLMTGAVYRAQKGIFESGAVTAVLFHNPNRRIFRRCVEWLTLQGYTFVSESQVLDFVKEKITLPPGSLWITFDDGWRENLHNVMPLLLERKIPATMFICTEPMTNSGAFWWSQVLRHRSKLPVEFRHDVNRLWLLPEEERKRVIESLRKRVAPNAAREAMTPKEAADLAKLPHLAIGSHTMHHVILPNCSQAEKRDELNTSRMILQEITAQPIFSFAYPNGDYDGAEAALFQKAGYQMAVTIENRTIRRGDDPFYLPRFIAMDDGYLSESICHLVGIWEPMMQRLRKFFHFRANRFGANAA